MPAPNKIAPPHDRLVNRTHPICYRLTEKVSKLGTRECVVCTRNILLYVHETGTPCRLPKHRFFFYTTVSKSTAARGNPDEISVIISTVLSWEHSSERKCPTDVLVAMDSGTSILCSLYSDRPGRTRTTVDSLALENTHWCYIIIHVHNM